VSIETLEGWPRPRPAQRQPRSSCGVRERERVVAEVRPTPCSPATNRASNGANLNLIIGSATLDPLSGTAYTAPTSARSGVPP